MRVATPYRCDYCGKLKEKTNHWWLVTELFRTERKKEILQIHPWTDELAAELEVGHVCSQACAVTALSKFMNPEPSESSLKVAPK